MIQYSIFTKKKPGDQNIPNPFTQETEIRFYLPADDYAKIEIYNSLGELINVPISDNFTKGTHSYLLQNKDLASGNYYYKLITSNSVIIKSMLIY